MAYNVLTGTVDGSVDQHGDQEIEGWKKFKNTVYAATFYDTSAQSECATLKDVAVKEIQGGGKGCVLLAHEGSTIRAESYLRVEEGDLVAKNVRAGKFIGSGELLNRLPGDKFLTPVGAQHIVHGRGLHAVRGALQVDVTDGLQVTEEGVGVRLGGESGLSVKSDRLVVDPSQAADIQGGGQNLSDADFLLVGDTSRRATYRTSLTNLYDNYLKDKVPQAAGSLHEVQLKGPKGFTSAPALQYNPKKRMLKVDGSTSTKHLHVQGAMIAHGAVIKNIKMVTESEYEVQDDDYTILCDTQQHHREKTTVVLPPACNNIGRILIIKKANLQKHSIKSGIVTIKSAEGNIDITGEMNINMNYSSRTLQSDGSNWWVIGTKGT